MHEYITGRRRKKKGDPPLEFGITLYYKLSQNVFESGEFCHDLVGRMKVNNKTAVYGAINVN
jgi:hypothetical protein